MKEINIPFDFNAFDSDLEEYSISIPKGFKVEINGNGVVLKKKNEDENNAALSEDDERIYRGLHNLIYSTPYCDSRKELSDWLESLKGRIQSKQEWSKEDEKCIRLNTDIIDSALRQDFVFNLIEIDALIGLNPLNRG